MRRELSVADATATYTIANRRRTIPPDGQGEDDLYLPRMRRELSEVVGAMPGLSGVEFHGRGGGRVDGCRQGTEGAR